jgi:hypothetical protein
MCVCVCTCRQIEIHVTVCGFWNGQEDINGGALTLVLTRAAMHCSPVSLCGFSQNSRWTQE